LAISIVNGFVCSSGCDQAKAKKGIDPHPRTGAGKPEDGNETMPDATGREGPAVLRGRRLASSNTVEPAATIESAATASTRRAGFRLDRIA
jgi:hypothetical protein